MVLETTLVNKKIEKPMNNTKKKKKKRKRAFDLRGCNLLLISAALTKVR